MDTRGSSCFMLLMTEVSLQLKAWPAFCGCALVSQRLAASGLPHLQLWQLDNVEFTSVSPGVLFPTLFSVSCGSSIGFPGLSLEERDRNIRSDVVYIMANANLLPSAQSLGLADGLREGASGSKKEIPIVGSPKTEDLAFPAAQRAFHWKTC